jgi:dTDP-4-amino-4,6-dideoxygalactose transaminase
MLFAQLGVDTTSVELAHDMPVSLPQEAPGAHHVYNQFVLRSSRRDSLRAYLATVGIDSAVYYPWPLHRQPAFARFGYAAGQFPHAERAAAECLAIPIHPTLTEPQQARVASAIMAHDTSPNRSIAPRPARAVRSE